MRNGLVFHCVKLHLKLVTATLPCPPQCPSELPHKTYTRNTKALYVLYRDS